MRKKSKKGGASILEKIGLKETNKRGIYIADDIEYSLRQGKKDELIKKYEDNLNEAKEEVKRARDEKERDLKDEKIQIDRDKATIEQRKHWNNQFQFFLKAIASIFVFLINLILRLAQYLGYLLQNAGFITKNFCKGTIALFKAGGGVVLKTIVLIGLIIAIFFGVSYFANNKKPGDKVNDIINDSKNYSSFLINNTRDKSNTLFSKFSNQFYNLIPDKYKFNFSFLKTRINKFVGNDLYEILGEEREKITTGRNDGIFHIKIDGDSEHTYTTLKPLPIEIPIISINTINNNDYNKLPKKIKDLYQNPSDSIFILPVEKDNNNAWYYDANGIKYKDDSQTLKDKNLKTPFINTSNLNVFKFNKEKAVIINDNDKETTAMLEKMFKYEEGKYKYPF
jgi:hypothetical protein